MSGNTDIIRPQYHLRPTASGFDAWDIRRLVRRAESIAAAPIPLSDIAELDENYWFHGATPTARAIVEHIALIDAADLRYPILLDAEGRLMDGMHRAARALRDGHDTILAKRFAATPAPDYRNADPDTLPYD
ncbi:hypothetical protein AADZ90_013150 [Aestuariibius sp. 2305UL40-4]|uniref:hypothetical protein n=1 Tax=Aestuariibius violaceus TaxID=3234132 RepID=UPI00345E1636